MISDIKEENISLSSISEYDPEVIMYCDRSYLWICLTQRMIPETFMKRRYRIHLKRRENILLLF